MEQILKNEKETLEFGQKLASKLQGGDILCLYGELGAGKTTLTKGLALGFGIKNEIHSPTFELMKVYAVKTLIPEQKHPETKIKHLVHIDAYRIEDGEELKEIGAQDYVGDLHTVTVIEWPEKAKTLLDKYYFKKVYLKHSKGGRKITFDV